MNITSFYKGPWKPLSVLFIASVAVGGYFVPLIGLAVPVLIVAALATNLGTKRYFCGNLCPNGRFFSAAFKGASLRRKLPRSLYSPELRRVLCGFMLFCVINLLVRSGGGLEPVARVFWAIYVFAVGIGVLMGLVFKPRAWCAVCPMGTLQDNLSGGRKSDRGPRIAED